MDNENNQIPQPGEQPPTTELPSIQQTPASEPSKTLEEISGINNKLNETAVPEQDNKAELYSKITRIALPVIVAIVLIAVGTFAYKMLMGPKETPEETPMEEVDLDIEVVDPEILIPASDELAEELEFAIQQGIEGGEIDPEEPSEPEEDLSIPGTPTITPIKITPIK
jgi:hypothetical protein